MFSGREAAMTANENHEENLIRIWEKAVDTQMHFNEMSVKSRQLGFTFIAAALGIATVLLSRGADFSIFFPTRFGTFHLHVSVLLIAISVIAIIAIRRLDLGVYHRMLRGAVTFGEDFEENHLKKIIGLEKGMTQAVSHYSRHADASKTTVDGKYHYFEGTAKLTAEDKIRRFYSFVVWMLILSAIVILVVTNFGIFQPPKTGINL
jgi:hypothetical protein